jgi:ferredoxin
LSALRHSPHEWCQSERSEESPFSGKGREADIQGKGAFVATIRMEGIGTTTALEGQRLVLAIMDAGVDILHRCGGNARCTTCRVQILGGDPGPMTEAERDKLATVDDKPDNMRLSCQVRCCDDLAVRILRRLVDNPDMSDAGPQPETWPRVCPGPRDESGDGRAAL